MNQLLLTQPLTCTIVFGDSRKMLPKLNKKADLIVTSPPYADARKTHYDSIVPEKYSQWFLTFNKSFYDILNEKGSFILNIKDKIVDGVRSRFVWKTVEGLSKKGWYSIDDYIWYKTNPMPGYWPTRLRDGWEYCFHLAKEKKPFMNQKAAGVPMGDWAVKRLSRLSGKDLSRHNSENNSGFGRDLRRWVEKREVLPSNVLVLPLVGKNYSHPAVFPVGLPEFFIKMFTEEGGIVIDPFAGSGSTAIAALSLGRNVILVDNNKDYCMIAEKRIKQELKKQEDKIIINKINF